MNEESAHVLFAENECIFHVTEVQSCHTIVKLQQKCKLQIACVYWQNFVQCDGFFMQINIK